MCFLASADFFSELTFSQIIFQEYHLVGPDLGPNCLQRLSADDTGWEKVKELTE